jgi:hypothetical protein
MVLDFGMLQGSLNDHDTGPITLCRVQTSLVADARTPLPYSIVFPRLNIRSL